MTDEERKALFAWMCKVERTLEQLIESRYASEEACREKLEEVKEARREAYGVLKTPRPGACDDPERGRM